MRLGERKWIEIEDLTDRVVVVPLGSLEQHGHHLPLLTDAMICSEIARRAEEELGNEALFLPTLWAGASDHHRAFPGTVSLGNDTYVRVLVDVLESLVAAGFKRIFLLNAHGGNVTPGQMAVYDVQVRHREEPGLYLAFGTWWQLAAEKIAAMEELEQETVSHACELETSMILRLHTELVKPEVARGAHIPFDSAFYTPDFSSPSRVTVPRGFEQGSQTGAYGHPEAATKEKGKALFEAASGEVIAFVREFGGWTVIQPQ